MTLINLLLLMRSSAGSVVASLADCDFEPWTGAASASMGIASNRGRACAVAKPTVITAKTTVSTRDRPNRLPMQVYPLREVGRFVRCESSQAQTDRSSGELD